MDSAEQNETQRDHYIELVGKIANIVEVLRHEPNGLSLQELAARTGYIKSSVHRIVNSLKRHSYIEQETPGGVYRLGVQFLLVARSMKTGNNLVQLARPYLETLVSSFDETVYLAVLRQGRGIFVDVEETRRDLRLVGPMSAEVHFHATAAGKAIAAFLPAESRAALLRNFHPLPLTRKTRLKVEEIEGEWAEVRGAGYAINDEETIPGAIFLAAPIFDGRKAVCGSLTVGLPKSRYSGDLKKRLVPVLKENCGQLSMKLEATGYICQSGNGAESFTT